MFAEGSRIFERTAIGVREAGARLTSPELGRVGKPQADRSVPRPHLWLGGVLPEQPGDEGA
jgi:hypothetical protein